MILKTIDFCITIIVQNFYGIDAGSRHAYPYMPMCRTVVFVEKCLEPTVTFVFFEYLFRKQDFYIGLLLIT